MSNTIASLLKELHIYHEIDPDSPLLHLPLSLFKKEEYADLITITLLDGDGWIKPNKVPKPQAVLGEISLEHVRQFYNAVKFRVSTALDNSIMDNFILGSEVDPLSVSRSPWVNPTQVTNFLGNNPTFKLLMSCLQCPEELIFFLKWYEETISPSDKDICSNHLRNLQSNESWKKSVDNLVATLTQLELLQPHPYPQRMIYEFLIKINHQLENLDKNNLSPEILNYYREVLVLLASKFPTTLESLCISVGILIPPTNIEGDLALLLRYDLAKVPGLTPEQWPQLLYYAALLLFQHTAIHPSLMSFTHSGKKLPEALAGVAEQHARHFEAFLQSPAQCKKAVDLDFSEIISEELKEKSLNVHPMLLTLLGFEQCDAFRNLMGTALGNNNESILTCRTIALKPSANRFLLGEALSRGKTKISTPLPISNHDLPLIEQLIELARKRKETTPPISPSIIDVSTKESPQQQKTPISNIHPFFIPLPPLKIPMMDEHESQFNVISSQIKDPILRTNLSISTMCEFSYIHVINYQAILSFILDFEINSTNKSNPSLEKLQEFFNVINDSSSLDLIFEELIHSKLFINLEHDIDSLNIQVKKLGKSIDKLDAILSDFTEPPKEEDLNLRYRWLNIQKEFCIRFKELVEQKIESIDSMQQSEEEHAMNRRMLGFLP